MPDVELDGIRVATLGDLAKAGSVFLRRAASAQDAPDDTVTREPIMTPRDIALGLPPSEVRPVDTDPVTNPPIRAGDVLVPAMARRVIARVATDEDAGAYPSSGVYVIRTDPAVIDPWYLAGYLSSTGGGRQAASVSSTVGSPGRVDPRRVRIPLLPLDAQRAYGDAFRRLGEFRRSLRSLYDLGQYLAGNGTDMVAAGLARTDDPAIAGRAGR
jgi:hypothetical protein